MAKGANPKAQARHNQAVQQAQTANRWAISKYLEELKFNSRIMGVDEADVWKKIEKLCELYENALTEERGRSEKLARQLKLCTNKLRTYAKEEKTAQEGQTDG